MSKRSSSFMPWVDVGKDLGNFDGTHQNGSSPPSLPLTSDQNRLKKFVRKGHWPVDHSIRQELWHHICMLNVVTAGSVYKETARALFGDEPHSSSSGKTNLNMMGVSTVSYSCYIGHRHQTSDCFLLIFVT